MAFSVQVVDQNDGIPGTCPTWNSNAACYSYNYSHRHTCWRLEGKQLVDIRVKNDYAVAVAWSTRAV